MTEKKIVLLDIDDVLFDTAHFKDSGLISYRLYDEVIEVLEGLGGIGEIGILSQGEQELQLKKLVKTGIHDRFIQEHIYIVEKKDESLREVLHKYKKLQATIYFIDDRLNSLYYAKKALPELITIWLKRGRYAGTQESIPGFEPDRVIENLGDIFLIVNKS